MSARKTTHARRARITSFLGCYSARKNKKFLLAIYLCCVTMLMAILIGGTVSMMNYSGQFSKTTPSGALTDQGEINVNNAVLSAFVRCCTGCMGIGSGTNQCTNPPISPDFANYFAGGTQLSGLCGATAAAPAGQCVVPPACTSTTQDFCFNYPTGTVLPMVPSTFTDKTVCTMLTGLSSNGHSIVGATSTGSCGGGQPKVFYSDIDGYFSPKMYFAAVLFIFIATVQGTILLGTRLLPLCIRMLPETRRTRALTAHCARQWASTSSFL